MKLEWRDVAPGDGPAISTSLTLAETDELRCLAKGKWPEHTKDCQIGKPDLTCTCGAYSRPPVTDVLEIGSAYGYSAVAMALAGARVTAVDPHNWLDSLPVMRGNLAVYGVADQVDIRVARSFEELPRLAADGRQFDVVWIDGDHARAAVAHDVEWAQKLVRPGGVIACHDHGEDTCPGVAEALDAWRPYDELVDTLAIYR